MKFKFLLVLIAIFFSQAFCHSINLPSSFVKDYKNYSMFMFDLDGTITINDGKNIEPEIIDVMIYLAGLGKDIVLCSGRSFSGIPKGKKDLKKHYLEIKERIIQKCGNPALLEHFYLSPQNGAFLVNCQKLDKVLMQRLNDFKILKQDIAVFQEHKSQRKSEHRLFKVLGHLTGGDLTEKDVLESFNDDSLLEFHLMQNSILDDLQLGNEALLSMEKQQKVFEILKQRLAKIGRKEGVDYFKKIEIGEKVIGCNFCIKIEPSKDFSNSGKLKQWKEIVKDLIMKILKEQGIDTTKFEITEGSEDKKIVFIPGFKGLDKSRIVGIFQQNGRKVMAFGDNGEIGGNDHEMLVLAATGVNVGAEKIKLNNVVLKCEKASLFILNNVRNFLDFFVSSDFNVHFYINKYIFSKPLFNFLSIEAQFKIRCAA